MTLDLKGRLLFLWVCYMQLYFTESLSWTVQPANQTEVIEGENKSLTWNYTLTADEQTKSQTFYLIQWKKFNPSSSDYVVIGSITFLNTIGRPVYDEPQAPHIEISKSNPATLLINNVKTEDEGTYKIEYSLELGGTVLADHEVNVTVLVPSGVDVSRNQSVCEGATVTLSCNATGKPIPTITWTRVWENGSDSGELPSVNGLYVISNITKSSNGTYRCTASNQVGDPAYKMTDVTVESSSSVDSVVISSKTAIEGNAYNMSCEVSGDPLPTVSWIKVSSDEHRVGKILSFTNISRNDAGSYTCEASNRCGNDSKTETIIVFYKPDDVTLERNTTENNGCSDMWVNFTCHSSEANPPVYNFMLLRNETDVALSEKGAWIEKISQGETFVYKCQAYQQVDNVTSTNNISLSVKVPPAVEQIQNLTVQEGRNVTKECKVIAGMPNPTVFWENVETGDTYNRNPLIITNIKRSEGGKYRCVANNTCGSDFTTTFIHVQFGLKNVTLEGNTTEHSGCVDIWVNFTCNSSVANPPAYDYLLLKNETEVDSNKKGNWIAQISRGETFVYQCRAYQKFNNVTSSNNITVTVNELPAVEHLQNETLDEGSNLTKECNVTAGSPSPTVFWETGYTFEGNRLIITNITRSQRGEYRCIANNTCGRVSATMFIDVLYGPDKVNLDITPSGKVCRGSTVKFTCTADANPPVHTYVLFENGTRDSTDEFGTWTKIMNSSGKFVFKCEAHSLKGNGTSKDTLLNVNDPPAVKQTPNVKVKEGENVTGECNLTAGTPPLNLFWQNVKTGKFDESGKLLTITNITRYQTEYRCVANNTCGRASTTMFIDVLYGPSANPLKIKPVTEGEHVAIPCLEDSGNPPAVVTWYKGNDTSGNETTNSSTLEVQNAAPSDEGWYTCFAKNDVGNASATFFLRVAPKTSSAPITEPSTVSILCSKALSENELRVSVTVEADCKNGSQVADKLVDKIVELLKNESCELGVSCVIKCGSVVVDSVLKFSKAIDGARVVSILKEAADQGRFNGLKVVSNSIIQISYTTTSSASTESPSPTEPVCQKSFSEKENCKKNWLNIGIVVCIGVFLFVIICCLITRWVLKQRKCKKDTRVANSPVDVQPLSSNHSTLSGDKPCDYAMSGPQPPIDVKVAVCEEIPTYAVVDKAKKKDKKKNKKAAEQKAIDDQYAVVDKSKKNKKNEPDNTYAEVDMSNKSKKKPKPGEVLYADLGEFHQMQKLPEVSTSPKTLPPIKRPEAYTETQYADITQFFKGNPEATGADHPKDGAASSASSNGQGPATGSKEESSAGNTGDSAGATNETGF